MTTRLEFERRCDQREMIRRRKLEEAARAVFIDRHKETPIPPDEATERRLRDFLEGYWHGRRIAQGEFTKLDQGFVEEDFT